MARSTNYRVYGHSPQYPYSHEPNTVVHTNQTVVPCDLPTEVYNCVLVIRRDIIIQVMERWVDREWTRVDFDTASYHLSGLIKNTVNRINGLAERQWLSRHVIHTEDFLNHPQHELSKLGLTQTCDLAPNRTKHRPWLYLENYRDLRQHLQLIHAHDFVHINKLLTKFLDK